LIPKDVAPERFDLIRLPAVAAYSVEAAAKAGVIRVIAAGLKEPRENSCNSCLTILGVICRAAARYQTKTHFHAYEKI
jgi:hypothetical protein